MDHCQVVFHSGFPDRFQVRMVWRHIFIQNGPNSNSPFGLTPLANLGHRMLHIQARDQYHPFQPLGRLGAIVSHVTVVGAVQAPLYLFILQSHDTGPGGWDEEMHIRSFVVHVLHPVVWFVILDARSGRFGPHPPGFSPGKTLVEGSVTQDTPIILGIDAVEVQLGAIFFYSCPRGDL